MSAPMEFTRDFAVQPARYYALFWRWHFFAALIVIPFVLWQSTTGTLYLWSQWWVDRAHPELRFVPPIGATASPSLQVAAAIGAIGNDANAISGSAMAHMHMGTAMGPNGKAMQVTSPAAKGAPVLDVLLPDDPKRSTTVLLQDTSGLPYPVFVNPHNGRVLGSLRAVEWVPGWSRSLHGGWPMGESGSWLLELGDCWAIVMIATGFYLWWPRGRRLSELLRPRFGSGTRVLLRDLHSIVAVLFSFIFLFFLVSALPWTSFWGGKILPVIENAIGQTSPAGFSVGGATAAQLSGVLGSLDRAVANARSGNVQGTLDVRLSPGPGASWWMTNAYTPAPDHTLEADVSDGRIQSDFTNAEIPAIPRFVAFGIHIHQADFGLINLWLNTAFALSLIWLTVTGVAAWWVRRPKNAWGTPPKVIVKWPKWLVATAMAASVALPIFGLSVVFIAIGDGLARMAKLPRRIINAG